jgi:hypothetical protein
LPGWRNILFILWDKIPFWNLFVCWRIHVTFVDLPMVIFLSPGNSGVARPDRFILFAGCPVRQNGFSPKFGYRKMGKSFNWLSPVPAIICILPISLCENCFRPPMGTFSLYEADVAGCSLCTGWPLVFVFGSKTSVV